MAQAGTPTPPLRRPLRPPVAAPATGALRSGGPWEGPTRRGANPAPGSEVEARPLGHREAPQDPGVAPGVALTFLHAPADQVGVHGPEEEAL